MQIILINLFLLLFVSQITISNSNFIAEIFFKWNTENSGKVSEVIDRSDSSANEESVDLEIEIIESNASPVMECITNELFRIYEPFCYRRTYGRGAGYPLNACPAQAPDKNGLLCYPNCRDGYDGVGPVCWENCGNMTAVGIFCVDTYIAELSYDEYEKSQNIKQLCSSCPSNSIDSEHSYKRIFVRKSYGRGVGVPLICSSEYEQNGALCYHFCDQRYFGVGPVCWQYCPLSQPVSCTVGCSITSTDCIEIVIDVVSVSIKLLSLKIARPLIKATTDNLIASATINDWISVAGNMSILANELADNVLSDIFKRCDDWPLDMLQSATKNVSLLLTVTAFNDTQILRPFLKLFDIFNIIKAFNHALCNLRDGFLFF